MSDVVIVSKRLLEVMPPEFMGLEYRGIRARDFAWTDVIAKHYCDVAPWPGHEKYVMVWYELENGFAVGWNENPSRGWSFPIVRMKS